MTEEIDLDANNLSIAEDAFEKFQSCSAADEDEYITLSDIVPPQPSIPDHSQDLSEIPYDNEVVLGSPSNDEGRVNSHDNGPQLLDISEKNVSNECRLDASGKEFINVDDSTNFEISNGKIKRQKLRDNIGRQDLSSDVLGAENYVVEHNTSIIQDALLSTTVNQCVATNETPEKKEGSSYPRRTKRGRIPNTAKYPMTMLPGQQGQVGQTGLDSGINTTGKRRPGRPKKIPPVQATIEPDSTNIDSTSLHPENGSKTDSGLDECTPNNVVKKGRRGRPKTSLNEDNAPTPRKRGRKPKVAPLSNEKISNSQINDNVLVELNKQDDVSLDSSHPNIDVNSLTLSTSKRKKTAPKKGNKTSLEPIFKSKNLAPCDKISDLDDDADEVSLNKLKQGLKVIDTLPNLDVSMSMSDIQNDKEAEPFIGFQDNGKGKLIDNIQNKTQVKLIEDVQNDIETKLAGDIQNIINSEEISGSSYKRNSKMPIMSDFEYNVDKAVKEATEDGENEVIGENDCLLVEDTSKRRRTVKKTFVYDEGSDEDPFANVESSDDEPKRKKKGSKCYSDDEYVPNNDGRKRGGGKIRSSSSESEDELMDEFMNSKKKNIGLSPFKKGRKPKSQVSTIITHPVDTTALVSTITAKVQDDDIEGCLETTMIKIDESLKPPAEAWATSNEFENFIAQKTHGTSLKIKKVSSKEKTETLAPLDIPVVNQNKPKTTAETSTQTNQCTSSVSVQTSAPYDIPMKSNISLTAAQSDKACAFLSSIVKTTSELGHLMAQKSDDFLKKKINTAHVTDTFKMDYCVRKSFLLFKLAKHNLLQMEEDLANQYDAFLKQHNLSSCQEIPKKIVPQQKVDSDSDCEIVEVLNATGSGVKNEKPKFNPKTVFLNKELSIKIAKKPNTPEQPAPGKKKLEMKGRHAVWINKNVMVKKVSPTQSFLAQDSRNKKPPDKYVTEKMVSDFFEDYYYAKACLMCAPFINNDWTTVRREYACHYFVNMVNTASTSKNNNDLSSDSTENNIETPDENSNLSEIGNTINKISLFSLCIEAIRKCLHANVKHNQAMATQKLTYNVTDGTDTKEPVTLFRLCITTLRADFLNQYKTQEDYDDTMERDNLLDLPDQKIRQSPQVMIEEMNDCSNEYNIHENNLNEKDNILSFQYNIQVMEDSPIDADVLPLTSICYQKILKMLYESKTHQGKLPIPYKVSMNNIGPKNDYYNIDDEEHIKSLCPIDEEVSMSADVSHRYNGSKSLITLCLELIQSLPRLPEISNVEASTTWCPNVCEMKSLKSIAFESIKHILYPCCDEITELIIDSEINEDFTINCVNTLSEEAFENLKQPPRISIRKQSQDCSNFSDGFDNEMEFNADHGADDNGWASQLQMQELKSCYTPHVNTSENFMAENIETPQEEEPHELVPEIKSEPIDYFAEENIIDTCIVKTEPVQALHANEMAHIPDDIITKKELIEATNVRGESPLISSSSYNVESFEQFVRTNKMIQSMDEANSEIFSQSALRIRRQHEPDIDQDHDMSMSLLVPHTFEPLHLVEAKGSLMETSSDDNGGSSRKNTGKKKDKRKKKCKKDAKATNSKETPLVKEKPVPVIENEVTVLTRRMRDKIRQEEKRIASSDSDTELYMLNSKKNKNKKVNSDHEGKKVGSSDSESETFYMFSAANDDKLKKSKEDNDNIKQPKNNHLSAERSKINKHKDNAVQCNNVDSTEKVDETRKTEAKEKFRFSGFSEIDRSEMTNYHKLMQFVYDKIIPSDNDDIVNNPNENLLALENEDISPIINPDEPVELLECEPTMPIFDEPNERPGPKKSKIKVKRNLGIVRETPQFTDRHGWHCYPIASKETKLYKNVQIVLEKLPVSFVETYEEYQDVMDKDLNDQEVDRLINLQSLNRSISVKEFKDGKPKSRLKGANKEASGQNSGNISRSTSPTYSDCFDELAPSDDEGHRVEDEIPPTMPARSSENNFAKNLLMDDHDSDSDGADGKKIKEEPKTKTKLDKADSESLMLTADKMMNKELNLLHAPIVLQDDAKEPIKKEINPKEETKASKRSSRKHRERVKNDDDTSSEEEKQWVSTKEKLLKRMGKKEDAVADETKRAKLVNEFIVKRNESDRKDKRGSDQGRRGRAKRKRMERIKQLRFLSNELYNEGDGIITGKRGAAAGLFKGRRNIRKVIDKKSLARSTVVANMEEFERKRRLNMRQNKLREVLACEEGVSVLVINDEVCLEYDFKEQRPVVTVHQFFTKVMKAHQYEGVKFMWDACFESLGTIESGHGGGGCILAHCMGLGKTLQVLALLHTVLTHPRANMHRVLVCCPLSTVLNWVDEIHKWIGPVTHEIKVFELSKLRKTYERAYQLEDWYNGGGIFIIGYELFRSLTTLDPEIDEIRPTIINKISSALLDPGPDIIVCDEGHLLKNDCSVLAVAMSRVRTKRRIVLTGTPMQNNLREYFCMVNFIKPNLLGTYSEYSNRFENPIMNGQHRDSVDEDIKLMKARTHILHKVLEGCLQRQEASVLYPYLPKKHEYTVFIPLTQCQWDLYNHYMDNYAKTNRQSVLRDFHILQKIWSHPQVLHSFQMKARDKKDKIKAEKIEDDLALADQEADIKPAETEVWWLQYLSEGAMLDCLDSSNKFVAVFRILHECVALGDKVLIFSTSLFCLDALEYFLKNINKWSLGQEYYRLDGSVPAEVRQKWCREFNAENNIKTKLFLISTRAGCLGLNMTAANRVIILDTSWNPAHDIQSIFRVYRFGQKKDCYIYRLVALGTMEQKIYERSVTKQAVACRVVDEQQIDRHYNLAELNELYSVDEMGLSVAGGVAVGVGDVALLRVARDAAIHAVHEHDSLLRGSGEQGLPEHERAAAWNQFQQEHEHKQMQNDLNANKAVIALKQLEMEHLRQQALYSATHEVPSNVVVVKSEPMFANSLLAPMEESGKTENRGRKSKRSDIVQCRIPIATGPQPGPSSYTQEDCQQDMVKKITSLLVKHNFMNDNSGSKQVSELVAKVKKMIATGMPMTLGPGYDELSSSIASVLLNREQPMPALTDIQQSIPDAERKRGRPKKSQVVEPEVSVPPIVPVETDGRMRRKAALAAEMQFDSQKDVIELDDDDDDGDDWQNYSEIIEDEPSPPVIEPSPPVIKPKPVKEIVMPSKKESKAKEVESSIVLSDDEAAPEVGAPATPAASTSSQDTEVVPLHPSLLTNSNFIKIVAHTYLAGNPMMDEDAATLAAQYSTLKTLKEYESDGKPIESGAVYDIAIKVLGRDVLRKLQAANPKTNGNGDSCAASNKLQTILGGNTETKTPAPAVKKVKIGPKSKMMKEEKHEPMQSRQPETAKIQTKNVQPGPKVVTISKSSLFAQSSASFTASNVSTPREESILPDEEVILSEPTPEPPTDRKPIIVKRVKIDRRSLVTLPKAPAMPVSMGRGPAPQATPSSNDTYICLDSDEEGAPPIPAPPPLRRQRHIIQMPKMVVQSQSAPIPVAITGPNAHPIPLPPPAPVSNSQPTYYTLSPCGTHAILLGSAPPVPISMTGPNGTTQPVPISLQGPGSQPVPVSFAGPSGSQVFQASYSAQGRSQPVPISLVGPDSQPIPMSLTGPGTAAGTTAYASPASQPVPMSLLDSNGRPIVFSTATPMHSQGPLTMRFPQTNQTMQIVPPPSTTSALTNAPRNCLPPQPSATATAGSNKPTKVVISKQKPIKTGDTMRVSKFDVLEILNRKLGKTTSNVPNHTIVEKPSLISPKPVEVATPSPAVRSQKEAQKRPVRCTSISSSSSSGRSRSSSPDPLAILKDVVHIQAPTKEIPISILPSTQNSKVSNTSSAKAPNPTTTKATPKPSTTWLTDSKAKGKQVSSSVDLTTSFVKSKNTYSGPKKQASASVDLTNTPANQRQSNRKTALKESGFYRTDSSQTSGSSTPVSMKKLNTTTPSAPSKLVGTSKSIILDGKSKSLIMETKSAASSTQVMSSKVFLSNSTSNQMSDKRPAPSTSAPAPKKRKTEPMTLKDFDIDDIDDIIELD